VGGSAGGWSAQYIDALIDMNPVPNDNITHFYGDITPIEKKNETKTHYIFN
jgi:hypothetical protein